MTIRMEKTNNRITLSAYCYYDKEEMIIWNFDKTHNGQVYFFCPLCLERCSLNINEGRKDLSIFNVAVKICKKEAE